MNTEQNKLILRFIPKSEKNYNEIFNENIEYNKEVWGVSLQYELNKKNANGVKYIDGIGITSDKEIDANSIIELCNNILKIYNKNDLSNADQKTRSFFAKRSKEIWHFYY